MTSWGSLGGVLGGPRGVPGRRRRPLGGLLERLKGLGMLLDASWGALGAVKGTLERLLAAPRRIPRQFAAILRAKRVAKGSPGGSQIGSRRRFELQTAKPQHFEDVLRNSLFFLSPRASENMFKTGPKWVPNRIVHAEALRKPLESLLERSWRPREPKKSWERLLAGLGPKGVANMGPQKTS